MATAKETLRRKVEELSEEEARRVLGLLAEKESREADGDLTLERIRERLKGHPGIYVPPPGLGPFPKVKRIRCTGIPASELLISDRR